jgi:4-hydroxy-tetrahydrodipicolinate synthase
MARAARELKLSGVYASAITPRRAGSQDPDVSGLLDLLDFLADGGVDGICLFDDTGEFLNYSFAERQRLLYLGAKRSRVPILVGVSHSTFEGAALLAEEAISSGADGLMLMAPYFFEYRPREIEEFFVQFAQETGSAVPIFVQNLPRSTSTLEFDLMRRLIDTGLFAGISDASGDRALFSRLVELKRERPLAVFSGDDRFAAEALRAGADGVISGAACAVPELVSRLCRAVKSDSLQIDALAARLREFTDWAAEFPAPVAIKRAVELRKQKSAPPLTPLAPETAVALNDFSEWFMSWLPETRKMAAHG